MSKKTYIEPIDNWETYEKELPFKQIYNCGNVDPDLYHDMIVNSMCKQVATAINVQNFRTRCKMKKKSLTTKMM